MLPTITAGIANTTMNDMMRIDHTNSGMRLSVIPGARSFKIVTINSTAATNAEISTNVIKVA